MKVQLLSILPEILVEILKSLNSESSFSLEVVKNGLPSDARCLGVSYDPAIGIVLKLESDEYENQYIGSRIPFQRPMELRRKEK